MLVSSATDSFLSILMSKLRAILSDITSDLLGLTQIRAFNSFGYMALSVSHVLLFTGRVYEHEGKLIVLIVVISLVWDLPIDLYPAAPPSQYRSGVSQQSTNPLTGIYRDTTQSVHGSHWR
jgi:hypothetical protein